MNHHYPQHGKEKGYAILTYGCQMNERDSEVLEGYLQDLGYVRADSKMFADLVILNTCCVREKAELKVLGKLGELNKLKKNNPNMLIAVCGCMTQQDALVKTLTKRAPYVDLVFGTYNLHQFPELLNEAITTGKSVYQVWDHEKEIVETLVSKRNDTIKAYCNISYGCNNYCTYCIVPYVRGRERSRTLNNILKEVKSLASQGYKEITLLGQNVNSYGKDIENGEDFSDLLVRINALDKIERIRYMTSHPRDFNDKLVETIARSSKVCEHFHLPIQAGSNAILSKMNRGYTREDYLRILSWIEAYFPNYSITSDIIVGFPGETDQDFEDTLDMVRKVRFDSAYTFAYSPRKGTPAATMQNQVPTPVKKERLSRLMGLINEISLQKNQALVGKTVEILVEGRSKTNDTILTGRTRTNKIVNFIGEEDHIGQLSQVKILSAQTWSLTGELA